MGKSYKFESTRSQTIRSGCGHRVSCRDLLSVAGGVRSRRGSRSKVAKNDSARALSVSTTDVAGVARKLATLTPVLAHCVAIPPPWKRSAPALTAGRRSPALLCSPPPSASCSDRGRPPPLTLTRGRWGSGCRCGLLGAWVWLWVWGGGGCGGLAVWPGCGEGAGGELRGGGRLRRLAEAGVDAGSRRPDRRAVLGRA